MIQVVSIMGAVSPPLSFDVLDDIQDGAFGKVYKARERGGKQRLLAVKQVSFRGDWSGLGVPDVLIREMVLMCRVCSDHPNIVT